MMVLTLMITAKLEAYLIQYLQSSSLILPFLVASLPLTLHHLSLLILFPLILQEDVLVLAANPASQTLLLTILCLCFPLSQINRISQLPYLVANYISPGLPVIAVPNFSQAILGKLLLMFSLVRTSYPSI